MTGNTQTLVKSAIGTVGEECTISATISSSELTSEISELKVRIIATATPSTVFYTDNWQLLEG